VPLTGDALDAAVAANREKHANDPIVLRGVGLIAHDTFRCNGTGAVPIGEVPHDPGSTNPTMEWTRLWMAAGVRCGELADPKREAGYCYARGACRRQ
jgi:hypothetical protein